MVARILVLLAGLVALFGHDASASDTRQCDRMLRRYERQCSPTPTPTPTPTPPPRPTASPLECEPIGGQQKFTVGTSRMFCFTAGPGSTFVAIEATSPANVGCAYFQLELTEPSGRKTLVDGASYPIMGSSEPRVVGDRYFFWVSPLWLGEQPGCDTYRMTVR